MTIVAKRRGVAGTVIDGVCRDLDRALEVDYPLFGRGHWMRTGKDRVQLEAIGVPVVIGGITVRPGDLLRGDIVLHECFAERGELEYRWLSEAYEELMVDGYGFGEEQSCVFTEPELDAAPELSRG
jgi:hypothetical protein